MFGTGLHGETLTVTTRTFGAPDLDGVPAVTVATFEYTGCNVQRSTAAETAERSSTLSAVGLRVSGPLDERITETSAVTWRGRQYEVDGEPAHFRGTGVLDHTEFTIVAHRG